MEIENWMIAEAAGLDIFKGTLASFDHFNGVQRETNLEPYLHGPIFEPIRKRRKQE